MRTEWEGTAQPIEICWGMGSMGRSRGKKQGSGHWLTWFCLVLSLMFLDIVILSIPFSVFFPWPMATHNIPSPWSMVAHNIPSQVLPQANNSKLYFHLITSLFSCMGQNWAILSSLVLTCFKYNSYFLSISTITNFLKNLFCTLSTSNPDLLSGVFPPPSNDSGVSDFASSSTTSPVLKTWCSLKLKILMKVKITPTAPQYRPHTRTEGVSVWNSSD